MEPEIFAERTADQITIGDAFDQFSLMNSETQTNTWSFERSAISALLAKPELLSQYKLSVDDFYFHQPKAIFRAIERRYLANEPVSIVLLYDDLITLDGHMVVDGFGSMLSELADDSAFHTDNFSIYVRTLKRQSKHRQVDYIAKKFGRMVTDATLLPDEIVENIQEEFRNLAQQDDDINEMRADAQIYKYISEHNLMQKSPPIQFSYGIETLDEDDISIKPGQLIAVAGRPGAGKTSFMTHTFLNAIRGGKTALFLSCEMTPLQLLDRMTASMCGVSLRTIAKSQYQGEQHKKWLEAATELYSTKAIISDLGGSATPTELKKLIHKAQAGGQKLDLVVVDYLQIMQADDKKYENRNLEVASISSALRVMAKEFQIPIIMGCQMSRMVLNRADKIPNLGDLRDSGAIEQDCHVVMFLHQEQENSEYVQLIVAKNRDGRLGKYQLHFDKPINRMSVA